MTNKSQNSVNVEIILLLSSHVFKSSSAEYNSLTYYSQACLVHDSYVNTSPPSVSSRSWENSLSLSFYTSNT